MRNEVVVPRGVAAAAVIRGDQHHVATVGEVNRDVEPDATARRLYQRCFYGRHKTGPHGETLLAGEQRAAEGPTEIALPHWARSKVDARNSDDGVGGHGGSTIASKTA